MALTSEQRKQLSQALRSAFPSRSTLAQLIHDLNHDLAIDRRTLDAAILELIQWAEAHDKVERLLSSALKRNPASKQLQNVAQQFGLIPPPPVQHSVNSPPAAQPATASSPAAQPATAASPKPSLADNTIVILIATVAGALAIIGFLFGVSSVPQLLGLVFPSATVPPTATATSTATSTALSTATLIVYNTPTSVLLTYTPVPQVTNTASATPDPTVTLVPPSATPPVATNTVEVLPTATETPASLGLPDSAIGATWRVLEVDPGAVKGTSGSSGILFKSDGSVSIIIAGNPSHSSRYESAATGVHIDNFLTDNYCQGIPNLNTGTGQVRYYLCAVQQVVSADEDQEGHLILKWGASGSGTMLFERLP